VLSLHSVRNRKGLFTQHGAVAALTITLQRQIQGEHKEDKNFQST